MLHQGRETAGAGCEQMKVGREVCGSERTGRGQKRKAQQDCGDMCSKTAHKCSLPALFRLTIRLFEKLLACRR